MTASRGSDVRFVTIADASYFPGLVAVVNSLRIHGHAETVSVLDLGLTATQRAELGGHCDFVAPPPEPHHPWLLAPFACLARPAGVTVYLDCDVVVTTPLDPIIDQARHGKHCAFADRVPDRWFAEWETVFALPAPPRRQPYLNAGFVALSAGAFPGLLEQWAERCANVVNESIEEADVDFAHPTALADQDALNALLMTVVDPARLAVLPAAGTSQGNRQLAATRVVDDRTLACVRDGAPVSVLHCFSVPKPWQPGARRHLPRTAYLRCLRRLLVGPGLAVRTTGGWVPWLAPGPWGAFVLRLHGARAALRVRTRFRSRRMLRRR